MQGPWRLEKAITAPISKKGRRGNLWSYRLLSPSLVPGKIKKLFLFTALLVHIKVKKVNGNSPHGFNQEAGLKNY